MKKWIVFLSVSCGICIIVFVLQISFIATTTKDYLQHKAVVIEFGNHTADKQWLNATYMPLLVKYSISAFLLLALFVFNAVMLISIALRKVTPLSISENLAEWKAHRADRHTERKKAKLEKAQSKVDQLQKEIEKDE